MAGGHASVFAMAGIPHEWESVAASTVVAVALTGVGLVVKSRLSSKAIDDYVLPKPKWTFMNFMISIVDFVRELLKAQIDHGADRFLPIIGTIFLFILATNLSGLVPGFTPASMSLNLNLGIALFVFVLYHYLGIREHKFGYLSQFTGGLPKKGYGAFLYIFLAAVALLVFCIELVGHAIRPVSLSLRLWGNITGDHTLVDVFNNICPIGLPVPFLLMGTLVSVIQAFVFALLSTVYIKLALSHDH